MAFDPSNDFAAIVDGLEAVTLEVRGRDDQAITNAHRGQHDRREAEPSDGQVLAAATIWQWPSDESERPPLGSVIVDGDGQRYTIIELAEQVLGAKYSATCRRLSIEAGLDTTVTIEQAAWTKSTAGEAVATWATLLAGQRARVQPVAQTTEIEHDARETNQRYDVILEREPPESVLAKFTSGVRVRDAEGSTYRVERYVAAERIDRLPKLECVKE